jgi:hypothetical protein
LIGETNYSRVSGLAIGGTECFGIGKLGFDKLKVGSITLLRTTLYNRLFPGDLFDTRGGSDTLACFGQVIGA